MQMKRSHDLINDLYKELKEQDSKYGGKKIRKAETDTHKKRPVKNLRKAWEQHEDDWEDQDDFFAD